MIFSDQDVLQIGHHIMHSSFHSGFLDVDEDEYAKLRLCSHI